MLHLALFKKSVNNYDVENMNVYYDEIEHEYLYIYIYYKLCIVFLNNKMKLKTLLRYIFFSYFKSVVTIDSI